MVLKNLTPKTQETYIRAVKGFADYYNLSPDRLTPLNIRDYLVYLKQKRKVSASTYHVTRAAIVCFYTGILKWKKYQLNLPVHKTVKRNPKILSIQEVQCLLSNIKNRKHRAILMTAYGTGLRVSELIHLKPIHIESDRMMVRVEQGKGQKDRYTILPERLLKELREYWKIYRPKIWLFPGKTKNNPITRYSVHQIYTRARKKSGIHHGAGIHTLRHCFATHLLEAGEDINRIKIWLGHRSILTTSIYINICSVQGNKVIHPLNTFES